MIGFYNYTVIITYLSLVSAVIGMVGAFNGNIKFAIICLLFSGLCDMTDGAVARTRKRTEQEKKFGIQIDSLCDLVSFGVHPAIIVFCISRMAFPDKKVMWYVALGIGIIFALCAVIRLAFFNVMEEERQKVEGNKRRTSYQGLPVTNISLILPGLYLFHFLFAGGVADPIFAIITMCGLAVTAFLYVLNFRMFKANGKQEIVIGIIGGLAALTIIIF